MKYNLLFYRRLIAITFTGALFHSCSLFDTSVVIPSYIRIDKITFLPGDTNIEGSASTNITDAWVYIDDQPVGAYELPVTFPVQHEGTHSIKIGAGIKMNGIGATRVIYPFYDFYNTNITLTPKEVTTITPTAQYFSGVTFSFVESFTTNPLFDTVGNSGSAMYIVSGAQAWGGGSSAYTRIGGDTLSFFGATTSSYLLQADGNAKFIELNYKCNHAFVVGLTKNGASTPILGLHPSEEWNKVYINITDHVLVTGNYGIYIAMQKLGTDTEIPELYFDNLKLIHN